MNRKKWGGILTLFLIIRIFATTAYADDNSNSSILLFTEPNFKGEMVKIKIVGNNFSEPDLLKYPEFENADVASLMITGNVQVILYNKKNLEGTASPLLRNNVEQLTGNYNAKALSLEVVDNKNIQNSKYNPGLYFYPIQEQIGEEMRMDQPTIDNAKLKSYAKGSGEHTIRAVGTYQIDRAQGESQIVTDQTLKLDLNETLTIKKIEPGVHFFPQKQFKGTPYSIPADALMKLDSPTKAVELSPFPNPNAQSMIIAGDYELSMFENTSKDAAITARSSYNDLQEILPKVSTLRVKKSTYKQNGQYKPGVYLYTGENFQGDEKKLDNEVKLADLNITSSKVSLRIVGDYMMTVTENGQTQRWTETEIADMDYPFIPFSKNAKIKVEKLNLGAYIFSEPDRGGKMQALEPGTYFFSKREYEMAKSEAASAQMIKSENFPENSLSDYHIVGPYFIRLLNPTNYREAIRAIGPNWVTGDNNDRSAAIQVVSLTS